MSSRKRSLSVAATLALSAAIIVSMTGIGSATDPTGLTSVVLAQGLVAHEFDANAAEGTDVVVSQNTFEAGGSSGWHSHPGASVIVVQSGQITIYRERLSGGPCLSQTYQAGDAFVERAAYEHNGVNEGTTEAVLTVTFFRVPHGGSARIDQPDPGDCPAT
jgi:quercetin dioxygenase-like cupin family protein